MVKISGGAVANGPVYLAIGIDCDCAKQAALKVLYPVVPGRAEPGGVPQPEHLNPQLGMERGVHGLLRRPNPSTMTSATLTYTDGRTLPCRGARSRIAVSAVQVRWTAQQQRAGRSADAHVRAGFGYHARDSRRCSSVGRAAVL